MTDNTGWARAPRFTLAEILERCSISPRDLSLWIQAGAITPAYRSSGTGDFHLWSSAQIDALEAIDAVRQDLHELGLRLSRTLVQRLWEQLATAETACINEGCVHIHVRRGWEDQ